MDISAHSHESQDWVFDPHRLQGFDFQPFTQYNTAQFPVHNDVLQDIFSLDESTSISQVLSWFQEELAVPVGCRLAYFTDRWRHLGAESITLRDMSNGLSLKWMDRLPPLRTAPGMPSDVSQPDKQTLLR